MVEQQGKFEVAVQILDMKLEKDEDGNLKFPNQNKAEMDFVVLLGDKEYGHMNIKKCAAGLNITVPLEGEASTNKLQLIANMPTEIAGSVSIPQDLIIKAAKRINDQWITLFDTLDDDEYDGVLGGEQDTEEPVIRVRFHLKETKPEPVSAAQEVAALLHTQKSVVESRKSQSIVEALMRDCSDSSSSSSSDLEDIPEEPEDGNRWDIEKELKRKGSYPNWELEWLQKLLEDKIMYLSGKVATMQANNNKVENSILSRLALLQDFSKALKRYADDSAAAVSKVKNENNLHKNSHDKVIKNNNGIAEDLQKRLKELEAEVAAGRLSLRKAEVDKLKAVNDFLTRDCCGANHTKNSESKKHLTEHRDVHAPKIAERTQTIENMHEHIRSTQVRITAICGQVSTYQAAMEVYAEEHSNLQNEIEKAKVNNKADQALSEVLRIENDAATTEVKLLNDQYDSTQQMLEDIQAEGEDLSAELMDRVSYQDERLGDGNAELAREASIVRDLLAKETCVMSEQERLEKLQESYAKLDKKLDEMVKSFNDSSALRTQARSRVANIRQEMKGNLNDKPVDIDLDEVDELCRKIQSQDETLLFDLQKLKMLVQVDQVTFAERNLLCDGIDELQSSTDHDQAQIDILLKVISKYQEKAEELREKLRKLIDELRKLKNRLAELRAETIRLHEEIQKLRKEIARLHKIYHEKWLELQQLDRDFVDAKSRTNGDTVPILRKELSDLLTHITLIMRAVPYNYMQGDDADQWVGEKLREKYINIPISCMAQETPGKYLIGEKMVIIEDETIRLAAPGSKRMPADDFIDKLMRNEGAEFYRQISNDPECKEGSLKKLKQKHATEQGKWATVMEQNHAYDATIGGHRHN